LKIKPLELHGTFFFVVPTLKEAENIDLLLTRIFSLKLTPDSFEVIVVDDASTDGTPERVRAWIERANVRFFERKENPGLAVSLLAGVIIATSFAQGFLGVTPPIYFR